MLKLPAEAFKKLLVDPVMAAEVLMGWKLDAFQRAALRMDWWFPETIDSSGVSTGKTLRIFIFSCLRCLLMPDQVGGVYFPNFQVGKDEFWPYFQKTIDQSPIFASQLRLHRKKLGEQKQPGAWIVEFKNGSKIIMPAPSFLQDSNTQASRRFNFLIVDDWLQAENMGEGIGMQLVDRVTRPNRNKEHPIWCNHIHLKGHAQRPSHKGYKRVKVFKEMIEGGSLRHCLYTFCFKDFTEEFAKKLRPDATLRTQRRVLSKDQFRRQWLGIWSRDGRAYYPEGVLRIACRHYLRPQWGRQYDHEVNILGFDVAPGQGLRADSSAAVNLRIVELLAGVKLPVTYEQDGRGYNISFTFATYLRNRSARETSAFIHQLHQRFGFARIVLDKGGGGFWVYKELRQREQEMNKKKFAVLPLVTEDDPFNMEGQPIVHFFKRGGAFDALILPHYLTNDGGFIEAMHEEYRKGWEAPDFHWPMPMEDRPSEAIRQFSQEQLDGQAALEKVLKELENVRIVTNKAGDPIISRAGFKQFEALGKKDGAYASLFAKSGAQLWFATGDVIEEDEERDDATILIG